MTVPSFLALRPGSRIALTPWAAEAANPVALAILEARCAELGVVVSTGKRRDGSWMVRAHESPLHRDSRIVSHIGRGNPVVVIEAALCEWEAGA